MPSWLLSMPLGLLLMQHQAVVAKPLLRAALKWLVVALAQPAVLKSLLPVVASAQPAVLKFRLAILVPLLHRAMVSDSD